MIGPRNRSWFGQKIPSWTEKTKNDVRTAAKKEARKTTPKKKPAAVEARRKLPDMKPQRAVVDKNVTEVSQSALRKNKVRGPTIVEYATDRRRRKTD